MLLSDFELILGRDPYNSYLQDDLEESLYGWLVAAGMEESRISKC